MSRCEDIIRLSHMLDYAREAVELMQDKKRADLEGSRVLQLALVRLIEVVGEAAGRVSKEKQRELSNIPWAEIVGMRNRLIHEYDFVDLDILFQRILSRPAFGDHPEFVVEVAPRDVLGNRAQHDTRLLLSRLDRLHVCANARKLLVGHVESPGGDGDHMVRIDPGTVSPDMRESRWMLVKG